ncbi:unnamed protein product [Closterium sp. NIES-65]|nr:unnamed protein product [Closterium sp. NIES-65]
MKVDDGSQVAGWRVLGGAVGVTVSAAAGLMVKAATGVAVQAGAVGTVKAAGGTVEAAGCSTAVRAAGNTFGTAFRVTTFGESHGGGVGCVVDGCPPRLPLTEKDLQVDLDRRRPGQSRITTPRKETDTCRILSGTAEGVTLGTPIAVLVPNQDQRGGDYSEIAVAYRPSHADATYDFKYGVRAIQGGGRSSARETIGRVAAGAIAKKLLALHSGTDVLAFVSQVHHVDLPEDAIDLDTVTLDQVEANIVRCPDAAIAERMIDAIDAVRVKGDSCGGVVTCVARNVPRGLGSPVFDKLEAELARALMSLPATKGFEIGSGFSGMPCDALLKGLRLFSVCIPPRRCPCSMPSCHSLLSLPATKGFEIGSGF